MISDFLHWIRLRRWWKAQPARWTKRDNKGLLYIDSNIHDRIQHVELRRQLAPMMQSLLPSSGTCEHCHWPWAFGTGHTIMLTESSGCFAVCEHCWNWLRGHSGGDKTIRQCYHASRVRYWPDMTEEQLDKALDKALGTRS